MSSRIIRLSHLVTEYVFQSEEDYDDLLDDLREECEIFGRLVNIVVPRPNLDPHRTPSGVGKAFLEYADLDGASRAMAINGKRYRGNIVVAEYYPENMYALGDLDG